MGDLVQQCMLKHNRPFNCQLVADLLATKGVKKAQAQRALDTLAADSKIRVKDFGKSKIYYPNRDGDILDAKEIASKRAHASQVQEECASAKQELAACRKELHSLQTASSLDELHDRISRLKTEAGRLESDVAPLRDGKQTISEDDYRTVEKIFEEYLGAWQRRKRLFYDIWTDMADGMNQKESATFEEAGIDTDEAIGVSCKQFAELTSKQRR